MTERGYDAIYLSPHADDAVLSCGGQLFERAQRGERVLVATVFTADVPSDLALSAFAASTLAAWGLSRERVMAQRRAEDAAATSVLGVELRHLGLVDAMFRGDARGPRYRTWDALRHARARDDQPALGRVAAALARIPRAPFIAAPLAAGHVDHRLVRHAAEQVFGPRLMLYEDLPYAQSRLRRWRALDAALRAETVVVSTPGRAAKRRALACYLSQQGVALAQGAERVLEQRGGERGWLRRE